MTYAEIEIENQIIKFTNSVFGIESVLVNGKNVSKKFAISGYRHQLKLNSGTFILRSKYDQLRKKEIQLELIKNDMLIEKHVVEIDKKQRVYWILLGTAMGIGTYELLKYIVAFLYDKI